MQALLELDCIPAGMELFPAANDDQWTLIKRVIDDCDYYIVILGGRYGSIGPAGISYTQMEYEYAVEKGKPVMAFLHKSPGDIIANKSESSPEGKQRLQSFRELAQKRLCKFWSTPSDLGSMVSRSLIKLIKDNPAIGWVKADLVPDKSASEEMLRLRSEIDSLKSQLNQVESDMSSVNNDLAQGADEVNIRYTYELYDESEEISFTYSENFNASWDSIFSRLSPFMIDEVSDRVLRTHLNQWISEVNRFQLMKEHSTNYTPESVKINDDDYNTLKVQLIALNLIKKSSSKGRSVKDQATYWCLTDHGEKSMMRLRAIKRDWRNSPNFLEIEAAPEK